MLKVTSDTASAERLEKHVRIIYRVNTAFQMAT